MRLSEAQRREPRALRGVRPGLLALALLATACQGARPPEALPERLPAPRLRGALPAASASVPLTGRPTPVVGSTVEEELSVSFHAGGMAPIRLSLEAAGAFAKVEGGGARIELSRLELQPESGALREDVLARLDSLDPPRGAQVGPLALLERAVAERGVAAASACGLKRFPAMSSAGIRSAGRTPTSCTQTTASASAASTSTGSIPTGTNAVAGAGLPSANSSRRNSRSREPSGWKMFV